MKDRLKRFMGAIPRLLVADRRLDEIKINQGRILEELHAARPREKLWDYEFKVFSQWGEDGIINHLTRSVNIPNRTFIEFGVEDFIESNCRYLLQRGHWQGFVIDGSEQHVGRLRKSDFFWRYPLGARVAFITRDNIAALLEESGFSRNLGLLSIDLDGIDYHVLEALNEWHPSILVVEYNAVFGYERAVTVPYAPDFVRRERHYSNQYSGASLPAFVHLANARGMALVGINSAGSNAFFVRRELLNACVHETNVSDLRRHASFRDSRDESGALTFLNPSARRAVIGDMKLIDVVSGKELTVAELPPEPGL